MAPTFYAQFYYSTISQQYTDTGCKPNILVEVESLYKVRKKLHAFTYIYNKVPVFPILYSLRRYLVNDIDYLSITVLTMRTRCSFSYTKRNRFLCMRRIYQLKNELHGHSTNQIHK